MDKRAKVIFIAGTSHTGKTVLAQRLMEKYKIPYVSADHIKMGLIRSGNTSLTPDMDEELTEYLWPILREMAKTAIENRQSLIIEGCYVPFDWKKDFSQEYLESISCKWLIMSERYIDERFDDILFYANAIEKRLDDSYCTKEWLMHDNARNLEMCKKYGCDYILIDEKYEVTPEL